MQLLNHMTLKNLVDISRAAYVQAKGKRVKSTNKIRGRVSAQFFGVAGHLCDLFVDYAVMKREERDAERVARLLSGTNKQAADGGLAAAAYGGDLRLGQLPSDADFGDDFFPIHSRSITVNCYLQTLFCYRFSVVLMHGH